MTGPAADLATLQDATDRLLTSVDALDDAALAEPSRLPGWTRGHVLAHLARNADALVNVLQGRPMYAGDAARDADIERDAHRPLAAHRTDLRRSATRFADTAAALTDAQWASTVTLRHGVTDRADRVPFRRWVEIELHHIDLDTDRTVADLPGAFLDRALDHLTERLTRHPGLPPVLLRAEDGRHWAAGRADADGDAQTISGTPAALVGWLSGRTTGSGLTTRGSLPDLPPL
jgi:maleylpyruvate isomerase